MLRIGLFASVFPLALLGLLSRGEIGTAARPCLAIGDTTLQIAHSPWQPAQLEVGFTDDPRLANVRVQIVDSAEAADFVVVDDGGTAAEACAVNNSTRFVAITDHAPAAGPLIYLSHETDADYRVYVKSRSFSPRAAAALIVGAGDGRGRIATAALGGHS